MSPGQNLAAVWEVARDLVTGGYPPFVTGGPLRPGEIPVFVHETLVTGSQILDPIKSVGIQFGHDILPGMFVHRLDCRVQVTGDHPEMYGWTAGCFTRR